MRLRGVFILVIVVAGWSGGMAQIDYRFSQFLQSPVPVNPSFSGIEDYLDAKVGYRMQWMGIEGSPTNLSLTLNHPFNVEELPENILKGLRTRSKQSYWDMEAASTFAKRKSGRHGAGLVLLNSTAGGFQHLSVGANYAYHLRITRELLWSVGGAAIFNNSRFDATNISVLNPANDLTYLNYLNNNGLVNLLDLNLGTTLYHQNFYVGYSALGIELVKFTEEQEPTVENRMVHSIQSGVNLAIGAGFTFSPSVVWYIRPNQPNRLLINTRIKWQNTIWGGIQYQHLSNVSGSIGGLISELISVNYAYSYPLTDISLVTSGSHEIILGIKLLNKNWSESYLW